MTDIVVRQPSSNNATFSKEYTISLDNCDIPEQPHDNENLTENDDGENPSVAPTMIGLGPLRDALTLTIKQRIRAFELISLCTGCEVRENQ